MLFPYGMTKTQDIKNVKVIIWVEAFLGPGSRVLKKPQGLGSIIFLML